MRVVAMLLGLVAVVSVMANWWAGRQAEHIQHAMFDQAQRTGALEVQRYDAQRGVFYTVGEGQLRLPRLNTAIDWSQTLYHGPFPWHGWLDGTVPLRPVQAAVQLTGKLGITTPFGTVSPDQPLYLSSVIDLDGDASGRLELEALDEEIYPAMRLQLEQLTGDYHVTADGKAIHASSRLSAGALRSSSQAIRVERLALDCQFALAASNVYLPDCRAGVDRVSQQPRTGDDADTFIVGDATARLSTTSAEDLLDAVVDLDIKDVKTPAARIASTHVQLTAAGVDISAINRFLASMTPHDLSNPQWVTQQIMGLAAQGSPQLALTLVSATAAPSGNRIQANARVEIDSRRIVGLSTLTLGLAASMRLSAEVGKQFIGTMDALCADIRDTLAGYCSRPPSAHFADWVRQGFLVDLGDRYTVDARYANARLTLNDKPISLFTLFRGTLGASG